MPQLEVFVRECGPIYRAAAGAISLCDVPALNHELGDDAVNCRTRIAEALVARGELAEVAGGVGTDGVVELEYYSSKRIAVDLHIEIDILDACGHERGREAREMEREQGSRRAHSGPDLNMMTARLSLTESHP